MSGRRSAHTPAWAWALLVAASLALAPRWAGAQEDPGWPHQIDAAKATILVYQPQLESFEADVLTGRAAFSVTPTGQQEPLFGAFWFSAKMRTDRDARLVYLEKMEVSEVRFPDATAEQIEKFSRLVETEMESTSQPISLDRLIAALDAAETQQAAAGKLNNAAPKIIFATRPAVLLLFDGDPILRAVPDSKLERAVNTPFLVVRDPGSGTYFMGDGANWYSAADPTGTWAPGASPPPEVLKLAPPDSALAAEGVAKQETPPDVYVSTAPAELVVTDGTPKYAPLVGNDLLYVSNTERNLFKDVGSQNFYLLLSGRWYASRTLDGPWSYTSGDQLPASFAKIPEESAKGDVLASVPGTAQAREAVLDAQIPQTAAIKRDEAKLEVVYDGEPKFEKVTGTEIEYAVNTPNQVLKTGGRYYACDNGVWFVADAPKGPWKVSEERPAEVDKLPPENPCYNTKYVYVYESTPQIVYVGYTPAYTGCYVYGGTVVYGTGYVYPAWVGPVYYYPRPYTWGFHAHYNPWTGWTFGIGVSNGFFSFGMTWGGGYYGRPYPGYPYHRPGYGGWYGPGGYRPPPPHYGRPGYPPRPTPYAARPVPYGGNNIYNRPETRDRVAAPSQQPARQPANRPNNIYAGKDGNVYRRDQNGWQQNQGGKWQAAPGGGGATRPGTGDVSRPPTPSPRPAQQPSARPGAGRPQQQLERDHQARNRGQQRAQGYQQSRPAPQPRQAPQRAPAGGGRRR